MDSKSSHSDQFAAENSDEFNAHRAPDQPLDLTLDATGRNKPDDLSGLPGTGNWQSVLLKFVVVEFALVPVALLLIYWCDLPNATNLSGQLIGEDSWLSAVVFGCMATIPVLALFVTAELCEPHFKSLQDLRQLVLTKLMPWLRGIPTWGLLLISIGAGIGEEWLFRGFFQQWMKSLVGAEAGIWIPILITSLLFGLCHAVSMTYFVATFLIGIYFGFLTEWTGSLLPAATSHALYDFIALVYLTQLDRRTCQPTGQLICQEAEQGSSDPIETTGNQSDAGV